MWHARTEALRARGALRLLGIVQEQHPDRARLYAQWQRFDWPIVVDSYNRLGVEVVPIVVAIDEHGVVRLVNPTFEQVEAFVATRYEPPARPAPPPASFMPPVLDELERAVAQTPGDARAHFELGVAARARHDSPARAPGDFRRAATHWTRAVALAPNNYIWRRRVQQYGPRLDKPYPFYDWIEEARAAIRARGEVPHPLVAEPGEAERAAPATTTPAPGPATEPDPAGKIQRDAAPLVHAEVAVVPSVVRRGAPVRVHVTLRPDGRAHWNNEVAPTRIWIATVAGLQPSHRLIELAHPPSDESDEPRTAELEVRVATDVPLGRRRLPGYALYYVCEETNGTCLFRRQDLTIELDVTE